MKCLSCGGKEIEVVKKKHSWYPVGCLVIVGVLICQLHQAQAPCSWKCRSCGAEFMARSVVAKVVLWMALLAAILIFGVMVGLLILDLNDIFAWF